MFLTSVFLPLSKVNLEIERKEGRKRKERERKEGERQRADYFYGNNFSGNWHENFPRGPQGRYPGTGGSKLFLLEMGGSLYTSWSAVW